MAAIIDAAKVEKLTHREVAVKFGVSPRLVSGLVTADRKDPEFVPSARRREMKKRLKMRAVVQTSLRKLQDAETAFRAKDVKAAVEDEHGIEVSCQYVCKVLRHDIGAKYKRVKRIPFLGNSPRCLLLRQHYAKFMMSQLESGVRIINLDQTWLNTTNFTR